MSTAVQRRRGTTAQHASFAGLEGELTVDTTKDTLVVHDGATTGGRPLLREDQSNLPTSAPTTGIYNASGSLAISTNSTGRLFIDSSGKVSIGTLTASTTAGGLDISSGGIGLVVGADGSTTTRTNSTDKIFRIGSAHYTNTEEPVCIAFGQNLSSDNELNFGGGSAALNAATYIRFFTAANNTTTTGTERMRLDSSGRLGLGTSTAYARLHSVQAATGEGLRIDGSGSGFALVVEGGTAYNTRARQVSIGGSYFSNTPPSNGLIVEGNVGVGTTSVNAKFQVSGGNIRLDNNQGVEWGGSNNYIYGNETTDFVAVATNGNECSRWDSSGRLLVGTSSSVDSSAKTQIVGDDSIRHLTFKYTGSSGGAEQQIKWVDKNNQVNAVICNNLQSDGIGTAAANLIFKTSTGGTVAEQMRIGQSGQISFFTNGDDSGTTVGVNFYVSGGAGRANWFNPSGATRSVQYFYYSTTEVGSIAVSSTATAYNTSSDYRLKENVTAVTDGVTRLQQLKPSRFNFIADPTKTVDGFLAHEVQTVVPEAITGDKDAVDDEGNPIYQGIDQSKLVPLLTAALQEAVAKIETLEARLTAAGF